MPFVRRGAAYRRGMGRASKSLCLPRSVAGVTPIPGIYQFAIRTGLAPGCSAAQQAVPFCSGIPYGQPGYTPVPLATRADI